VAAVLIVLAVPASGAAAPVLRGVAVDALHGETAEQVTADVDAAARLGANALRVSVWWEGLEPGGKGDRAAWYLDRLDLLVDRARAHGLRVLLTPVGTPCWASSAPGAPGGCDAAGRGVPASAAHPPRDPADYADLVRFLVGRYRTALAGVEVWNEPNLEGFWATPDAGAYAALVRAVHGAVERLAPEVPVVAGVLAGSDTAYLERLYAAGISGHYDALSVHAYNDGRAPETLLDPRWIRATLLQGLQALGETLAAHREDAPLWITEMGWNTSSQRGLLWNDGVTPQEQADYLRRALGMLGDRSSGIGYAASVFVYRLRDLGDDPADPQHGYGLLRRDGTAKPAFAAVRDAFAALAREAPAAAPDAGAVAPAAPAPGTGAAAAAGKASALLRITTPRAGAHGRLLRRLRGTAVLARGERVELAVTRRAGGRGCRTLGAGGRLRAARRCARPRFLRTAGGERWTLALPRGLPAGRYLVVARTVRPRGGGRPAVVRRREQAQLRLR